MKPVMGDNTILIIKRLSFEDLKEGMIVAYRGDKSNPVVHQLILKIKDRGIVKGWNNRIVDEVMVTEDNLIGVILGMVYYDLEEEDIGHPKYLLRN